ncbi:MAG: hypothetical protein ACYTG0_06690 [Planctomycetota bacterium]|jgi:hypothetical protein
MFIICHVKCRCRFRRIIDGTPLIFDSQDEGEDHLLARPELIGSWYVRALSVAQMLRAFRRMLRDYRHPQQRGHRLCDLLRNATVDRYVRRNKTSRDYPRKKQESPPGTPTITKANRQQIQHAKQVTARNKQKG